jgi:4-amino-4-deoxy-L-arabinose transferase-like glycosyltransferase
MPDRFYAKLITLLLIAALLRIIFSVFVVGWQAPPRGDEIDYHTISRQLADGEGFTLADDVPTARRPPFYPVFLTAFYKIFGARMAVGRILQIVLGVAVVLLTYVAAKRYFSPGTAWIAAVLATFNPFLIFICGYLLAENLYMVLLLGFLIVLPMGKMWMDSTKRLVLAAFLLSLLALTRPSGFPYVVFICCVLVFSGGGSLRLRIARLSLLVFIWIIPFVPWALRNQAAFGKTVFFTTHGGTTFYEGNNAAVRDTPRYYGGVAPLHALPGKERLKRVGEVEKNREAWRLGMTFIRENPNDVPVMVWRKFLRFWRLRSNAGFSGVKGGWWWNKEGFLGNIASSFDVGFAYAVIVLPLFLVGLCGSIRRFRKFAFCHGVILMHTLVALVFFGSLRSRIPLEPVIAIFAASGFYTIVDWFRGRRAEREIKAILNSDEKFEEKSN